MRRKFWIDADDFSYGISTGDNEGVMNVAAYDRPHVDELIPVTELHPGDVILSASEFEKIRDEISYLYGHWIGLNAFTSKIKDPKRAETEEVIDILTQAKERGEKG